MPLPPPAAIRGGPGWPPPPTATSYGHPAVPLLAGPHLQPVLFPLVVVAEQVEDPVHQEQADLRGDVSIMRRRDRGADDHVAEEVVLVLRERQNVGGPGLSHV